MRTNIHINNSEEREKMKQKYLLVYVIRTFIFYNNNPSCRKKIKLLRTYILKKQLNLKQYYIFKFLGVGGGGVLHFLNLKHVSLEIPVGYLVHNYKAYTLHHCLYLF